MLRSMTGASAQSAARELPDVFRVSCPFGDGGIVHVYYVAGPQPCLVDTGVRRSASEAIEPALQAHGLSLRDVQHVLLTHGHWDHMGGTAAVRALAPQARTYAATGDRHLFDSTGAHASGYVTYPFRLLGDEQGLHDTQRMVRESIDCPVQVDVFVEDGQAFDVGGRRLRAVATPGHSRGSTSYLLEPDGVLFTGDAIQGLGSRPGQLPLIFEDSRAYRATIARAAELPLRTLCLGHSFCGLAAGAGRDPVRRDAQAQLILQESGETAKAIEEAMRSDLQEHATAPFLEVARRTLAALAGPLGLSLDERGLNARSLATLHAFYRELTGAPAPV
jgi:glyoxylase-like metal-dependent hydrolase (beta-lactamase superfamily II)